ncbi:MAG: T9SS type A sorting domain-containing protein [Bacteroidia bacterium]
MKKHCILFFSMLILLGSSAIHAQGTWMALNTMPVDTAGGGMLLLSDGTVVAKTFTASSGLYGSVGDIWNRLTPDSTGSYVNGTWSHIAPMNSTRLYFSSQMLKDGRLYVAGGEYGRGLNKAETYDPVADTWTPVPVPGGDTLYDANSAMLPDGKVLQAVIVSPALNSNILFDPLSNSYLPAPASHGSPDEAAFVKLPDHSILYVQNPIITVNYRSERYIPATNQWVQDAFLPDSLWKHSEIGTGMLLPNGKAIFFGASGHTAYYTPSGTIAPGTWTAGPDLPGGLGTADAAAAMLPNGNILLVASPKPSSDTSVFLTPTFFLEFDYRSNQFTMLTAPGGGPSINATCYQFNLLNLPDGTVMLSYMGDTHYYIYKSPGTPLLSAKPTIGVLSGSNCRYTLTGTLFNGICEGSSYGDDWQTATNYPIIRFTKGTNVYYARTFNWNRTGVQTGTLADTVQFMVPAYMPGGTYAMQVTANGVASDAVMWTYVPCATGIAEQQQTEAALSVFPNPTGGLTNIEFINKQGGAYTVRLFDMFGREIFQEQGHGDPGRNLLKLQTGGFAKGVYLLSLTNKDDTLLARLVVE